MEEDIKNMSKEELLEYLEEISQQLDNIALDQIKIAIAEYSPISICLKNNRFANTIKPSIITNIFEVLTFLE